MKKRLRKLLASVMVFTVTLSGLSLSNPVEVGAWNASNSSNSSVSAGSGTSGVHPSYQGSGYRIYLVDSDLVSDKDPNEYDNIFTDAKYYLSGSDEREVSRSILFTSRSKSSTGVIYDMMDIKGVVYRSSTEGRRYSKLSSVFKGISDIGLDLDPVDFGSYITCNLSNSYWKNTFGSYIDKNYEKAVKEFLSVFGAPASEVLDSDEAYCFVVEPVVFWKDGTVKALSWLQISDKSGDNISSIFDASMNQGKELVTRYLSRIKKDDVNTFKIFRAISKMVPSGKVLNNQYTISRDVNSLDSNLNGYSVFGVDAGMDDGDLAKTSTSFSIFYKNNLLSDDGDLSVAGSVNIVSDVTNAKVDTNLYKPSIRWEDIVIDSYGSKKVVNPFRTSASASVDSAITKLTGYSATNWENVKENYVPIMTGASTIKFANVEGYTTNNLYTALRNAMTGIQSYKVTPYSEKVTGSNENIGSTYSMKLSGQSADTITNKVANYLASKSQAYVNNSATKVTSDVITGIKRTASYFSVNSNLRSLLSANPLENVTPSKFSTDGSKSEMGVSVAVYARDKQITSHIAYATLNRTTGEITLDTSKNKSTTYSMSRGTEFTIPSGFGKCLYVAIPNSSFNLGSNTSGSKIFNKLKDITNISNYRQAIEAMGYDVEVSNNLRSGSTIGVGATAKGGGYSILVLELDGYTNKTSTLTLKDYHLNYIYPTMLNSKNFDRLSGATSYLKYGTKNIYSSCENDNTTYKSDLYYTSNQVKVTASNSYGGSMISINDNLGTNKNILRNNTVFTDSTQYFVTEAIARDKIVTTDVDKFTFSLAVNLTRSSFSDVRTVSTMTSQTIDKSFAQMNLGLTYGVTPTSKVLSGTSKRSSDSLIKKTLTDKFYWDTALYFKDTNTTSRYRTYIDNVIVDDCIGHETKSNITMSAGSNSTKSTIYGISYDPAVKYKVVRSTKHGALQSGSAYVRYTVSEKAYKYDSDKLATATNKSGVVSNSLQVSSSGLNSNKSLISNPYKVALVENSSKTLKFYPEVTMLAYTTSGHTIDATKPVATHKVTVIGEYLRSLKPSSMRAIKVNTGNGAILSGKTKSDATAVGSNASNISGNLPVIYAGGNISLNIKSNLSLSMYSYSLDLIGKSDNNLNGGSTSYKSVVSGGTDVKAVWGNGSSYNPLDEFNSWIKDTVSKIGIDTTLTVKGSGVNKTYNNFNTSFKSLSSGDSAVADGVFSIQVKNGTITNNAGYKALIAQIKSDYGLSTDADAKALFKASGIYQSILDAVEDTNDSFNKSDKVSAISSNDHWYDETVKTFVIRRYKKENIKIGNVLVNDKLDYGSAPTANKDVTSNNSYKSADAKWYMTVYFKDLPEGFSSKDSVYSPKSYNTLTKATNSGTVLVNQLYVSGADFVVPSASTYDMGNR